MIPLHVQSDICPLSHVQGDCAGLDDEDFWADFSLEDPLMQAVDAAMGCNVSDDSCL